MSSAGPHSSLKPSRNPGLALELKVDASFEDLFSRQLPSAISSMSNTPLLEPDWLSDIDDMSIYDDDAEVQYIFIEADNQFFRPPASPHTSSYLSFNGFPFACDALAEEDPLFGLSSDDSFEEELDPDNWNNGLIVIVDTDLAEDADTQLSLEWKFTENLDQIKPARIGVDKNEASV
ncbi:hypothetical protein H0H93_007644 [Arthromyces matolae]|nr:hypothetical protein H0H93_007644 [Arthromyces matolae]